MHKKCKNEWLAESELKLHQNAIRDPSRQQTIEWALAAWETFPAKGIQKLCKLWAISSSLDGSEEGNIMCMKHGPSESLLPKLQAVPVQSEEIYPLECDILKE